MMRPGGASRRERPRGPREAAASQEEGREGAWGAGWRLGRALVTSSGPPVPRAPAPAAGWSPARSFSG